MPAQHAPDSEEPVPWSRTVTARWMLATGAVLGVGLVVAALLAEGEARRVCLWLLLAAAAFLATGSVRVTVTDEGVTAASAAFPFLRRRIRLARIRHASAHRSRPAQLGGWGYRWRPGRSAVSLRAGDALWLELISGAEFVITVDDAATAARLVNARLARARP